MPKFAGLTVFIGSEVVGGETYPAPGVALDDDGHLCQSFRKSLLRSQDHFEAGIRLPGLLPLDLDWRGIGQTAGVALWVRDGGVVGCEKWTHGAN